MSYWVPSRRSDQTAIAPPAPSEMMSAKSCSSACVQIGTPSGCHCASDRVGRNAVRPVTKITMCGFMVGERVFLIMMSSQDEDVVGDADKIRGGRIQARGARVRERFAWHICHAGECCLPEVRMGDCAW